MTAESILMYDNPYIIKHEFIKNKLYEYIKYDI